jgi:hypothetical protein
MQGIRFAYDVAREYCFQEFCCVVVDIAISKILKSWGFLGEQDTFIQPHPVKVIGPRVSRCIIYLEVLLSCSNQGTDWHLHKGELHDIAPTFPRPPTNIGCDFLWVHTTLWGSFCCFYREYLLSSNLTCSYLLYFSASCC